MFKEESLCNLCKISSYHIISFYHHDHKVRVGQSPLEGLAEVNSRPARQAGDWNPRGGDGGGRLDSHPQLSVLVQQELVGGGQVGDSLLQLLDLSPQLEVLLLDHLEGVWRRSSLAVRTLQTASLSVRPPPPLEHPNTRLVLIEIMAQAEGSRSPPGLVSVHLQVVLHGIEVAELTAGVSDTQTLNRKYVGTF